MESLQTEQSSLSLSISCDAGREQDGASLLSGYRVVTGLQRSSFSSVGDADVSAWKPTDSERL